MAAQASTQVRAINFMLLGAAMGLAACSTGSTDNHVKSAPPAVSKPEEEITSAKSKTMPAKLPRAEPEPSKSVLLQPEPAKPILPEGERKKTVDLGAERSRLLETDNTFARRCEEKGAAQAFYEFLAPD